MTSGRIMPTFELSVGVPHTSYCDVMGGFLASRRRRATARKLAQTYLLTHEMAGLRRDKAKPVWFWLKTAKKDFEGDYLFYSSVHERLGVKCLPPPWEILHEHIPQDGLAHGLMALATPKYKSGGPQALPNQSIMSLSRQGQPTLYNSVIVIAYQMRATQFSGEPSSAVVVEDLQMRDFGKIVEAYQRRENISRQASPL